MLLLLQCENWGELSLLSNKSESLLDAFVEEENGLDIAFQDIEQDGRNMSWIPAFSIQREFSLKVVRNCLFMHNSRVKDSGHDSSFNVNACILNCHF